MEFKMEHNLSVYDFSRNVPTEAQKQFNNGKFSGTDINPMWRIKKLTEMFGPCGIGWYYEVLSERSERIDENTLFAIVDLNLYIKVDGEWSKPIYGTGGNTLSKMTRQGANSSDEGYKMALTDALSVACKALGIGADIYWGADKTKYSAASAPVATPEQVAPPASERASANTPKEPQHFDAAPDDVTQEMLTSIGNAYTSGKTVDEKRTIAAEIKAINNGSSNYKSVPDAGLRKELYNYFHGKMNA